MEKDMTPFGNALLVSPKGCDRSIIKVKRVYKQLSSQTNYNRYEKRWINHPFPMASGACVQPGIKGAVRGQ
jgi:hypothetical protein